MLRNRGSNGFNRAVIEYKNDRKSTKKLHLSYDQDNAFYKPDPTTLQ